MDARITYHKELSEQGFSALERVIAYSCSRCGLCAALCPTGAIEMVDSVPSLAGKCTNCGLCYQGCPRSFVPGSRIKKRWFGEERTELDRRVGRCVDRFTSRALTDQIFDQGATGGTATALIAYLLENGHVDAVLHLESIHKGSYICHHAQTRISTTPADALKGARSKNQLTPILQDLPKLVEYGQAAIVCLSCHVEALRKLQLVRENPELREAFPGLAARADKLIANIAFVIAINCFANTKPGGIDAIYEHFRVQESDVIKYAEDTKKSLYQLLNEGKSFLWFVQDGFMTRDGNYYPFKYTDFLEQTIPMGCMVCPSFIVCKEADVSIGVTASETKLYEFGYNSVFVRTERLKNIFASMVEEKKLLRRPMWENKGTLLRKFVERMIPEKDMVNFKDYVRTGTWNPSEDLYKRASSAHSGSIMGLQRLFLTQTVKKKIMYLPALAALKTEGKHVPEHMGGEY